MTLYVRILIAVVVAAIVSAAVMHFFVVHHEGVPISGANTRVYVISLILVFATTVLVLSPVQRWLSNLEHTAQRLREGDLNARVEIRGSSSIARVGRHINDMAEDIQHLVHNQRELLQTVSHEFRTPIARLRFLVEILETTQSDEERTRRLTEVDQNLTDLDDLVNELLIYARFDQPNTPELRKESIDVHAEIVSMVESTKQYQPEIAVVLELANGSPSPILDVNLRYFRRVIQNLVQNAKRHAMHTVTIVTSMSDDILTLHFEDDGRGIAKVDRDRVWEPFVRLESDHTNSGGTGLGLAIVQRIVEWHHGSVEVGESVVGGARFTTHWPVGS